MVNRKSYLLLFKRLFVLLAILCTFLFVSCNPFNPVENEPLNSQWTIGLDPGHGWTNNEGKIASGAVGNGLQEKDVTLYIALRTKAILENNGFQVIMTRTGDDQHDLTQAAKVINEQNPNIVISIHANGGVSNATGTEACYTVGKGTDLESKALAQLLTDSISTKLSLRNRGIFPENSESRCARTSSTGWSQLYIHDMNPPVALIETAFISNSSDADLLKNRSQDFAQAIADAIIAYSQARGFIIAAPQLPLPAAVASLDEIYTNSQYGFSVNYPTGWKYEVIAEGINDEPKLIHVAFANSTKPTANAAVTVSFAYTDVGYYPPEVDLHSPVSVLDYEVYYFFDDIVSIETAQSVQIDSRPAAVTMVIQRDAEMGIVSSRMAVIIPNDNAIFLFFGYSAEQEWPTYKAIIDGMLNSIRFYP